MRAAFVTLGLNRVKCATAESLVFAYLRGEGDELSFAVVADVDGALLREGGVPFILTRPADATSTVANPDACQIDAQSLQIGRDYVVESGEIVIRDPESGCTFPGRRYSGTLHAEIQAREGLPMDPVSDVVAQTTLLDYLRLYKKLAIVVAAQDRGE
jgi:hypothetical protein